MEQYFRRQRTMLGVAAMEQVALLHVLVVGLRGVGVEIAKCLALTGCQRLTLLDDDLVREEDFAANFLLREGDRRKPKAKLIASRLNALCPFADVRTIPGALTLDLLLNYHFSREELIAYNEFCRAQSPPIGFVLAESRGVVGFVFTDFSAQHIAEDEDALLEFRIHTARTLVTDTSVTVHVRELHLDTALGVGDSVCLRIMPTATTSNGTSNCEAGDAKERLICEVESILSPGSVLLRIPSYLKTDKQRHEFQKHIKVATHMKKLKRRSTTVHHQSLRTRIIDPGDIACPTEMHRSDPGLGAFNRRESADIDESVVMRFLSCPASEFQALSAPIAGYASIQAVKFTADNLPDSKLQLCSMSKRKPVDHESWGKAHIICCDSLTLADKFWIDSHLEERRKIVGKVASELDQFSLHSNPRTPSGIMKSFQTASAGHLLQLCKRVQPTVFASDKPEKLHAHFIQSLVSIEASACGSSVLPDLSSLRGLSGEPADFLPVSTILAAFATFEIFKMVQSRFNASRNHIFTLPNITNGGGLGAYKLQSCSPQPPLQMRSLALEVTRGVPLRAIPENWTAWSKINVPTSKELQSVESIVKYIKHF
uniref:Ubiquitin-like 1-activating enzyme E1A n=1 Tax=Globisporangium ultimum (strain ATCC 200006 / CBS 805.95 / DAOM BR144) TaxID=431595 RepID=K3WDM6_GLOUD